MVHADEALVVYRSSGEADVYFLAQRPELTYTDGNLTIVSEQASASYDLSALSHAQFEMRDPSKVCSLENQELQFHYDGSTVRIIGLPSSETVTLFDLAGHQILSSKVSDTEVRIDCTSLQSGTYIVSTSNRSLKIHVK